MLGMVPHLVRPAEPVVSTVFLRYDTHWRAVHVRRGVRQALPQGQLANPPAAAAGPRCCLLRRRDALARPLAARTQPGPVLDCAPSIPVQHRMFVNSYERNLSSVISYCILCHKTGCRETAAPRRSCRGGRMIVVDLKVTSIEFHAALLLNRTGCRRAAALRRSCGGGRCRCCARWRTPPPAAVRRSAPRMAPACCWACCATRPIRQSPCSFMAH